MKARKRSKCLNCSPAQIAFTFVIVCFSIACFPQVPDTVSFDYKSLGLENRKLNEIQNASALDSFFETLYRLKKNRDTVVNIIHLGDSHIQADFMTSIVRRRLQERFGNAGRGLIFPSREAGTNEPFNIVSSSNVSWTARRIVQPVPTLPIGISGITIRTDQPHARLNIYMRDLWLDYSFNRVGIFMESSDSTFQLHLKDTTGRELAVIPNGATVNSDYKEVPLTSSVEAVVIEASQSRDIENHFTLFGLRLMNRKPGVQYHAIGVNGAKYEQYKSATMLLTETAILSPSLIIVSLGTNESQAMPTLDKNFLSHVDSLIRTLTRINPRAGILLTTPQETFRKKVRTNPGSLTIRNQIIEYAVEHGYAFWDCYAAMGSAGSASAWRKGGFFRADGVHLTIHGYEYQGELFSHALIKGYNDYVSLRRQ